MQIQSQPVAPLIPLQRTSAVGPVVPQAFQTAAVSSSQTSQTTLLLPSVGALGSALPTIDLILPQKVATLPVTKLYAGIQQVNQELEVLKQGLLDLHGMMESLNQGDVKDQGALVAMSQKLKDMEALFKQYGIDLKVETFQDPETGKTQFKMGRLERGGETFEFSHEGARQLGVKLAEELLAQTLLRENRLNDYGAAFEKHPERNTSEGLKAQKELNLGRLLVKAIATEFIETGVAAGLSRAEMQQRAQSIGEHVNQQYELAKALAEVEEAGVNTQLDEASSDHQAAAQAAFEAGSARLAQAMQDSTGEALTDDALSTTGLQQKVLQKRKIQNLLEGSQLELRFEQERHLNRKQALRQAQNAAMLEKQLQRPEDR